MGADEKSSAASRKPDLGAAYSVRTPEDNMLLYRDWAATYDADFAERMTFRTPERVASAFVAAGGGGPVLDAGAGTGLLGMALASRGIGPVDALDISPQMLDVARAKGCYRCLAVADLTRALPQLPAYRGVVSSGTFTRGHVGPDALDRLLAVAEPGAVFAFSVYSGVWESGGFAAHLTSLEPLIAGLEVTVEPVYADAPDPAHRNDTCMIVVFRKI